jgi:hypothetical protein
MKLKEFALKLMSIPSRVRTAPWSVPTARQKNILVTFVVVLIAAAANYQFYIKPPELTADQILEQEMIKKWMAEHEIIAARDYEIYLAKQKNPNNDQLPKLK